MWICFYIYHQVCLGVVILVRSMEVTCFLWLFETASQIACYSIPAALMEQLIELFEQKLDMACFFLSELSFALQVVSGKLGII